MAHLSDVSKYILNRIWGKTAAIQPYLEYIRLIPEEVRIKIAPKIVSAIVWV